VSAAAGNAAAASSSSARREILELMAGTPPDCCKHDVASTMSQGTFAQKCKIAFVQNAPAALGAAGDTT
jgi:predicted house-cleaning NTP pyrophosphatase (Maf/HAM1 superfamily)